MVQFLQKQPANPTMGPIMINKEELCQKIVALYPDIGECGIDVKVEFDKDQNAWVVDLKKKTLPWTILRSS